MRCNIIQQRYRVRAENLHRARGEVIASVRFNEGRRADISLAPLSLSFPFRGYIYKVRPSSAFSGELDESPRAR